MAIGPGGGAARRPKPAGTVNQAVRDRGIAHAVYLEKLKNNEAAEIVDFYDKQVVPDLLAKLEKRVATIAERGLDLGPETTQRLRVLIEALQETVDAWTTGLSSDLKDRLDAIGQHEAEWQAGSINSVVPPQINVLFETVIPAPATVAAAIASSPIDGVLLADIVERLGRASTERIESEIRKSIVAGETIPQITRRVRDVTDLTRSTAEAVARTAVGHASNIARQQTYAANDTLIKGVQWVATLDTRTCPTCMALDGKVFKIDAGDRPPRHINCRCTTVPVLKSWSELGIVAKDISAGTRASMNGQVSGKITYADWIKTQSAEVQDAALGPARGALLRGGKFEVGDFVDRRGDKLSLDALRHADPAGSA